MRAGKTLLASMFLTKGSLPQFPRRTGSSMTFRLLAPLLLGAAWGLLIPGAARAASLQPVSDWDADGVPLTVSMYLYVPDNVAANAPVLVLAHYCGGTAAAVFGQAQGGGVVAAADQYGFIMVVPQATNSDGSGRCWDVGSTSALSRDGGGDTEAVVRMVDYTLDHHDANSERVYVTGDSSGGMMTQALLALYPDVFKAGAAFAGVPAGCWAVDNPDGAWSGPCAGGSVTHTPDEWRSIVESMYPGYTGRRPRVQLVHGDADDIISYTNHSEAIEQWTAVLGLSESPTSTQTVQLGTHQATRQVWQNSCGYVVLDAFSSRGGDHGPSDALFAADYVIPFLGLDQPGVADPEIVLCDDVSGSGSDLTVSTVTAGTTSSTGSGPSSVAATSASGSSGSLTNGGTTAGDGSSSGTGGTESFTAGPTSASDTSSSVSAGGVPNAATHDGLTGSGGGVVTDGSGIPPEARGCGCRAAGNQPSSLPLGVFVLVGLLGLRRVRRDGALLRALEPILLVGRTGRKRLFHF